MRLVHKAKWVVKDPDTVIEEGAILCEEGSVVAVGRPEDFRGTPEVDHGDAVLTAPLVNAHTHLELSALKGRVPNEGGFQGWVKSLIAQRDACSDDFLLKAADVSVDEAKASGTLLFGEISTLGITRPLFESGRAGGLFWQEQIGNQRVLDLKSEGASARLGLAAHAPHTTAPELIQAISDQAERAKPFSIHLDESPAESEFISTAAGPWAEFLAMRGIACGSWPIPAENPVAYLDSLGVLGPHSVVVHLLQSSPKDFERLAERGVTAVSCPRSNEYIHGKSPDIKGMLDAGLTVALGTDSLASCESLSIADEMAEVARIAPEIPAREIFRMATENGARALGLWPQAGAIASGVSLPLLVWRFDELDFSSFSFERFYNTPRGVEVIS